MTSRWARISSWLGPDGPAGWPVRTGRHSPARSGSHRTVRSFTVDPVAWIRQACSPQPFPTGTSARRNPRDQPPGIQHRRPPSSGSRTSSSTNAGSRRSRLWRHPAVPRSDVVDFDRWGDKGLVLISASLAEFQRASDPWPVIRSNRSPRSVRMRRTRRVLRPMPNWIIWWSGYT